jgi:hypothetical protein
MGHTEVVSEDEEVGDMEDELAWDEWQDGVFRAERPAERAICSRGTEGSESRVLWVCMKRLARVVQRD